MPPPTPEAVERLKVLARALAAQTRAGRLNWKDRSSSDVLSRAINAERFSVSLPKSTITVFAVPGITVTDSAGEILQEYLPVLSGLTTSREASLDAALKDLLHEIREEQRRALSVLDDIISDVEGLGSP
ncbi:hypothetical protein [Micromonospora chalcea]|uniref:hypothetical protein n=1 Tax=Micromonospora chalcea TaxID=1874 RepID=UPI0033D96CAE